MIKLITTVLVLLAFFVGQDHALDAANYTAYIEELMQDEQFVEEYAKWSFELFSQPDYLYGDKHKVFPCAVKKDSIVPTSVHTLRPTDVKCVGAMGDSLTAALGAHALTPVGLFFENRGVSWAVGGDHTYQKILSVPNALRQYNTDLEGFSTKVSVIFLNGENATNNRLNVAKSGDQSTSMPYQAKVIMERMKDEKLCNWANDWKVITLFIGGNDLCSFCEDPDNSKHTPEVYMANVRDALDILYNAPLPRTLVNLVLTMDVRGVKDLNAGGFICQTLHKKTCLCAAFPTEDQARTLDEYVPRYQQILIDLVDSGRYDGRDDFTVVIQPFMAKTKIPLKDNHKIDFSYFAPDCFHFSGKGHSQAALSLWNNMLEPVGAKQWAWHMGETLTCPTDEFPYIFTSKNSAKALAAYKNSSPSSAATTPRTTPRGISTTPRGISTTPRGISTTQPDATSARHHKKHKHDKSDSSDKIKYAAYAGFFLLVLILLVVSIRRRQQIRVFVHGAGRRHLDGFNNPQYPDDSDEVDIWNRLNTKSTGSINSDKIPKTHGTRISFE